MSRSGSFIRTQKGDDLGIQLLVVSAEPRHASLIAEVPQPLPLWSHGYLLLSLDLLVGKC